MITPRFTLEQDQNRIIITILAPYTNVKETEIHVLDEDVRFYSAPYYLRLTLPGKVVENEESSAKYIVDTNSFVITLDKLTPGEVFPNLDMLTSFLQTKKEKKTNEPLIEVLSSTGEENSEELIDGDEWSVEQTLDQEMSPVDVLLNQYKYGFANRHSGLCSKYEVELSSVSEIKSPDSLSPSERQAMREDEEKRRFSDDHYCADFVANDEISTLLAFKFRCRDGLSNKNRDQLKNLCNRTYLLSKSWQKRVYLGLVDILFSYLYDIRITDGSHCVESPWNISRISSTLCWFQVFENVNEVVHACIRRCMSYPLYRHWGLALKTFEDVILVLNSEPSVLLKCFLDIHSLFKSKEPYYLLNQLYIEDYCIWIQQMSCENTKRMVDALQKAVVEVRKEDMGFDLIELEVAARLTVEEEMEEEISQEISEMQL